MCLRPTSSRTRRLLRLAVAWLVAIVLPLQGLSTAFAMTVGPLHVHQQADGGPVLVDLRRAFAAPRYAVPEAMSEWQHASSHLLPQRHMHAPLDASVVDLPDPLASKQPNKAKFQEALFIAIVPAVANWVSLAPASALPLGPRWSPKTVSTRCPQRPPRAA